MYSRQLHSWALGRRALLLERLLGSFKGLTGHRIHSTTAKEKQMVDLRSDTGEL